MSNRPPLNLIRQQCDGELSPEQAAQLQNHLANHPEQRQQAADRLAFEQSLRNRVGSVMNQPGKAPWELKNRIRMAMQAQDTATAARPSSLDRSRRLWSRPRANIFAIAATLALITGAVLFGIFGRTIDDIPNPSTTIDLAAEMATYAGREHDLCAADEKILQEKTAFRTPPAAETALTTTMGAPVRVADLSSLGYEFRGAGPCSLPADVKSSHLVYQKTEPDGRSPMVSVFVFPNTRKCGTKICDGAKKACGEWEIAMSPCSQCNHRVLRTTSGDLVYLLVCCAEKDMDSIAKAVAHSLGATPADSGAGHLQGSSDQPG